MIKRKLIIDCDAGVDDAFAIMLALSREDTEVIAITCVGGNTSLDQVCINVMKTLECCQRTDIPVFKGAGKPLIAKHEPSASHFHGYDGLGDSSNLKTPDMSLLQKEHAVDALIRLANDDVTLVALGPLTNLALASRLDPDFSKRLRKTVIMGGNCEAKGNDGKPCAEFNFHSDPEAAFVTLNEFECPLSLVTWEICLKHYFEWEFFEKLTSQASNKSKFLKSISKLSADFYKQRKDGFGYHYVCCDLLAMGVAVQPDIVTRQALVHATVELNGHYTTGQMAVDWLGALSRPPTMKLVQEVDMAKYSEMVMSSVM
ncbi:predicted protein [Nematostella vectensis]|uniref:Inosine/uridine-preferring nucleoside hydrolase domain-containing protein n=1 Tax=Nematostella vectensis TaxID=45351 RepID=A7S2K9_NEMVE|nr:inosine-uridine preferring nucleoside hydrolase [Nematostella vectensis]EDO42061.1 predicted protein [Nematostella vectensis]|eukprot:XP_001634124.1 predicted protein [Nematostella vectensis]